MTAREATSRRPLPNGAFRCPVSCSVRTSAALVVELVQSERLRLPRHVHDKALVSLLLCGSYSERHGSRTLDHAPLAVAFHPPGMEHWDEAGAGLRMLVIELEPDGPLRHFSELGARPPRFLESPGAWRAMWGLRAQLYAGNSPCAATNEGLLLDLLSELELGERGKAEKGERHPPWLDEVVERLRGSYREGVSFAAIAAQAGVHVGHLWRAFRRAHGCSPSTYVQRLRCRHVIDRLTRPDADAAAATRLADVALEAGFSDQSHLNRVFKRTMGIAPGALRASLRRAGKFYG